MTSTPDFFTLITRANACAEPLTLLRPDQSVSTANREKVRALLGAWFFSSASVAASLTTMLDGSLCLFQELLLLAQKQMTPAMRTALAERLTQLAALCTSLSEADVNAAIEERKHAMALMESLDTPTAFPTPGSESIN